MFDKDFFRYQEEADALTAATAICEVLGRPTWTSLDDIIDDSERELERLKAETRLQARLVKSLKGLLSTDPRNREISKAVAMAEEDAALIFDLLKQGIVPMQIEDILEHCGPDVFNIPETRVRLVLKQLAHEGWVGFGPDGWFVLTEGERSGGAG